MRYPVLCVATLALGLLAGAACGGAQPDNLAPPGSGDEGGSGGSSGSSSGGHDAAMPADASTGPVDATQPIPDTGTPDVATVDVAVPMEAAPVGPAVPCPMQGQPATCNPGDYCCVQGDPDQGTQTDNCQTSNQACTGGTTVHCGVAADCPTKDVCCGVQAVVQGMTVYTEVSCLPSCDGAGHITFCDPSGNDCPEAAPNCTTSELLPGYNVCNP